MSHELRTPMNSIIGFTGMLLKQLPGPLNEEQNKQLTIVKNSSVHLLGLINDILDISKIEADKLELSLAPFNYLLTIENTIEFLSPQVNKKELQIKIEFSETKIVLNSDERRVEQVLMNLLSNAIKFSNKGTIFVKVAVQNNFITTQIIDQGIGISKEDQIKLFNPFTQLNTGLSRSYEGTGLGLAICKSLIEKLGGTIQISSKKGEGSNFTFKLPLE
jgi:signal transduction histidine kinase